MVCAGKEIEKSTLFGGKGGGGECIQDAENRILLPSVSTLLSLIEVSKTYNLGQIKWKLRPPLPPKSVMGKWRVLAFTCLHPWFGGKGAFLFHFNLSKIVYEPLPGVTSSIWGNHDTKSALVRSKVTSSESTPPIQKINWAGRHWKKQNKMQVVSWTFLGVHQSWCLWIHCLVPHLRFGYT